MTFELEIDESELSKLLKLFNIKFDVMYHKVSQIDTKVKISVTTADDDYEIMEVLMEEFDTITIEHSISITDNNNKKIASVMILTNGKCEIRDSNNEAIMEYIDCNWQDIFKEVLYSSSYDTKFTDLRNK